MDLDSEIRHIVAEGVEGIQDQFIVLYLVQNGNPSFQFGYFLLEVDTAVAARRRGE